MDKRHWLEGSLRVRKDRAGLKAVLNGLQTLKEYVNKFFYYLSFCVIRFIAEIRDMDFFVYVGFCK